MGIARAHDELVGRAFGEFVLRERIGEGGFGAVYRATQPALDREAVVKVLHRQLHASKAAAERFLREAKLASKLDHPYAAHIYAFGAEPDGELWIAMEHVRGTPLDQVLKLQGALSLERFVPLLDRLCEVVHNAHEQGIVHRDIKPANVMVLARSGRLLPKLLDFGIAKGLAPSGSMAEDTASGDTQMSAVTPPRPTTPPPLAAIEVSGPTLADTGQPPAPGQRGDEVSEDTGELTQRGAIMGSPLYMAPEQWLDATHVDARTDLYALGVLAFESLTGKPPFTGNSVTRIAQGHAVDPVPSLGVRFPVALDKVFQTVLAKRADDRYPDALAFATAFRLAAGLTQESVTIPALGAAHRELAVMRAPQPIADAVASLDAARNLHQARDAIAQAARTITRYVGLLAVACRSRVSAGDEPAEASEALRALTRRPLTDVEWLNLARGLTAPWTSRRDAYPVPELVDAFHGRGAGEALAELVTLRDREASAESGLQALVEGALATLGQTLEKLDFIAEYPLVAVIANNMCERWMGVGSARRQTTQMRGHGLEVGAVGLLGHDGAPVLTLAPLFQLAVPSPGAPLQMFMFDGKDARGARLLSLPAGFEHHDDALWDWLRAQLSSTVDDSTADTSDERAPFLGLSAFSVEDGSRFYGRERLVDEVANRLRVQALLAVVGRSGAGKSSFVHAGVVPALGAWRAVSVRPGSSPFAALAARLEHAGFAPIPRAQLAADRDALGDHLRADAARRGPVVLVVDQLEELFTLCQDDAERRAFAEAAAAAARSADDPVRVIFTLRDDFLVRTQQVPALRNQIGQGLQLLTVPASEDLVRILVEPTRRAGYELEAGLAAEMVAEVADQPGALALLSFTAAKLWELRDRHFRQLTRSAYRTLGGVGGALARHADQTLDAMPAEERALAREAFRHLVTAQSTRAVLARKDLRQLLGSSSHADGVIEKLVAARLLVASENEAGAETIEIVHEALLTAWPRLVEWAREDADGAHFREQLRAAAAQWHERSRPRGLLWRGDALGDYTRWRARHAGPLTELEAAFADESVAAEARGRRNRRLALATVIASLVAVVVGLVVFNTRLAGQRRAAEEASSHLHDNLERQYEDQGRRLMLAGDPLQALAFLDRARTYGAGGAAHDFLVAQAVQATNGELLELHHGNGVRGPHFSHDGSKLATASIDHTARVSDAKTGKELLKLVSDEPVSFAMFSADDKRVVTFSYGGHITIWDARTGTQLHRLSSGEAFSCVALARDETQLAALGTNGTLVEWSLPDGAERVRIPGPPPGERTGCALSPDHALAVTGDDKGAIRVWDLASGKLARELAGPPEAVLTMAYSPDGTRFASASSEGTAIVWDAATGARLQTFTHRAAIPAIAFSPDGQLLATASNDRTGAVWDVRTGKRKLTLDGHAAEITRAVFSPDGTKLVATSADATASLWDLHSGRALARWRGHEDRIFDAAFDPAGSRVVTAGDDGTAIVWQVQAQEQVVWLDAHAWIAHLSHDGRRLVTGGTDGVVRLWDPASGQELRVLSGHKGRVTSVVFSPDDRQLATAADDGTVRIWDTDSDRPPRVLGGTAAATNESEGIVDWSSDGASIVMSNDRLRCWDAATGRLRFEIKPHADYRVYGASFAPSGKEILTSGADATTRFWDLDGHLTHETHDGVERLSTAYDPSGRRVASAVGRRAIIWDAATGETQVNLVGDVSFVGDAQWSPDGTWVLTGAGDGAARIWDATSGDLLATYTHPGYVATSISFARAGDRIVIARLDGSVEIVTLPRPPTEAALAEILRCRVPFTFDGDRIVPRRRGC